MLDRNNAELGKGVPRKHALDAACELLLFLLLRNRESQIALDTAPPTRVPALDPHRRTVLAARTWPREPSRAHLPVARSHKLNSRIATELSIRVTPQYNFGFLLTSYGLTIELKALLLKAMLLSFLEIEQY
jgi:hypothetical protein